MNYNYDKDCTNDAILASQNAVSCMENIPGYISKAAGLMGDVKVSGLDFLSDSSYLDIIDISSGYPAIIIGMMNTAERDMIIDCVENGDMATLVGYVNDGRISTQALIEYGKEYMVNIMNNGEANTYNRGFSIIGGDGASYRNVNSALSAMGFSDEFINGLSNEYCKNLIYNDLMYTKEGTVTTATSFIGLLSMFELKLGYEHKEYEKSDFGFYFGHSGKSGLGAIDCCNFTDWLARCVGVDIMTGNQKEKYKYCDDGITPANQIYAGINDEYYKKAEGGDYLVTEDHIMMVVANDGKGYFYADNGDYAEISYKTYEQLSALGYKVHNTDALFRNTGSPQHGDYVWLDENGNLSTTQSGTKVKKEELYANPYWIINQDNINLTAEEQKKLIEQYKKNNKNPAFTGVEFIPEIEETIPEIENPVGAVDVSNKEDSGNVITAEYNANGITQEVIDYATRGHTDGPQAYETWYPDDMRYVVRNMETIYGYTNIVHDVRNDGVNVLSGTAPDGTKFEGLVMVATDVRHPLENPNGTFERGEIVDTTLGKGIVVDACGKAIEKRENNQGPHFDISTAWYDEKYKSQIYDENGNPRKLSESSSFVKDLDNNSSSTPSTPSAPSKPSAPSTPSAPSKPSTPSTPSVTVSNILPENKFSDYMPGLTSGRLRGMEISQSGVSYEILGISNETYTDYISSLLKKGYVLSPDGTYTNGTHRIVASINEDGTMNIDFGLIV